MAPITQQFKLLCPNYRIAPKNAADQNNAAVKNLEAPRGMLDVLGRRRYTIEVGGTDGIPFAGTCIVVSASGSSSQDLAGFVPQVLQATGEIVSCMIQKKAEEGTLLLKIKSSNGSLVVESATSQPYGAALASSQ